MKEDETAPAGGGVQAPPKVEASERRAYQPPDFERRPLDHLLLAGGASSSDIGFLRKA